MSVQLNAIVNREQQETDENTKIATNKHSAARTAVEQPCDVSPCFMSFRKIANHVARGSMPTVGLVVTIEKIFANLKERGVLDLVD